MNCQPIPTETPGIFRCPECGLQNPRPIKKPFHHQCGSYTPPEPRSAEEIREILDVLCPGCKHYHWPDKTCHATTCKHGTPVARIAMRGNCPKDHW